MFFFSAIWLNACIRFVHMTHYAFHMANCVCTLQCYTPLCTQLDWLCIYFMEMTHYALHMEHCVCTHHGYDPLRLHWTNFVYTSWKWHILDFIWILACLHVMDMTHYALHLTHCVFTSWKWSVMHFMWIIVCVHVMYMTQYALHLAQSVYTLHENGPLCTPRGSLYVYTSWK